MSGLAVIFVRGACVAVTKIGDSGHGHANARCGIKFSIAILETKNCRAQTERPHIPATQAAGRAMSNQQVPHIQRSRDPQSPEDPQEPDDPIATYLFSPSGTFSCNPRSCRRSGESTLHLLYPIGGGIFPESPSTVNSALRSSSPESESRPR
jgi:hypothetical protein